jgi:hypothetical protein
MSQGKTTGREGILYRWLVFLRSLGAAGLMLCVGFFPWVETLFQARAHGRNHVVVVA